MCSPITAVSGFLHMQTRLYPPIYLAVATLTGLLTACIATSSDTAEHKLRSLGVVLGADIPFLFPEKIVVGPAGDLYLLDTELSNIFIISKGSNSASRLCTPKFPGVISDISVDADDRIWILDAARSKVVKLNQQCEVEATFKCRRTPLKLHISGDGEVVVLTGEGETLFDLYSPDGTLLRSFGQRIRYDNPSADNVLNDGRFAPDAAGGFYFSFNYPLLIQHYSPGARLTSELKPDLKMRIDPPEILSRREGTLLEVSQRYQVPVLDMDVDGRGQLHLLISGKDKVDAFMEGTRQLVTTTDTGEIIQRVSLDNSFHRLAISGDTLYLLRNREPLRLEKFSIETPDHLSRVSRH